MKYGIWRHENALGNSAEQCVNLSNYIQSTKDDDPYVYVESEFQADFALCIPKVTRDRVDFYPSNIDRDNLNSKYYSYPELARVKMPSVYFPNGYPSVWANLKGIRFFLEFPTEFYSPRIQRHNFDTKNMIVMQFREAGTYWKRVDGSNSEPRRNVDIRTFFSLAIRYADKGYTVVRIGDKNQTPMPIHHNIIDHARRNDTRMLDDLYLIANSRLFLSTDSGVWPMAGGLKKKMVLSNVASSYLENGELYKPEITDWLDGTITRILPKKYQGRFIDNTMEEVVSAMDSLL